MGGGGKKQTVGYKYSIGAHMVLIQGIADRLTRIRVGDKNAWSGGSTGGRININAPSLFGGEKREGGIVGAVDFETGGATQPRNDYLQARLGAAIPAFRGVTAAVLRQVYIGLNPYLKAWAFRIQRIHKRQDGATQWYDAKAAIGIAWAIPQTFYFALDCSNSMNQMTGNGQTRHQNAKYALSLALAKIRDRKEASADVRVDVMIVAWGGTPTNFYDRSSIVRRDITAADIADLQSWVMSRTAPSEYGTYFPAAVMDAPTYFAGSAAGAERKLFFITDGQPQIPNIADSENSPAAQATATEAGQTVAGIADLSAYGINIDLSDTTQTAKLDNTPGDGVPVVSGANPQAIADAIDFSSYYGHMDMNPAHIIRECLTDRYWGMGYQESDIDAASFTVAADKLYAEGMGISILWDRQSDIQAFVDEVVRHIDAALYVSRTSGQFVLKLIRDDYDIGTIPTLGESEIETVEDYSRPAWGELLNSVTVNYWDHETGKTASLTCDDPAAVQLQGAVNNTTIEYPGFSNGYIAARVAARDLRALSTPLLSCTIYANRSAAGLNIGDVFKFNWPDYHDGELVMRVTGIALGDGRNNKVRIQCAQDVFALPAAPTIMQPAPSAPVYAAAAPVTARIASEVPYFEAVQRMGQRDVDAVIADTPLVGYVMAAGARPDDNAVSAQLYTDAGAGYDAAGPLDFAPAAFLSATVGKTATALPIASTSDLDALRVGSLALLGAEIVRIDAVSDTVITVGRGCLDTVPATHAAGTLLIGYDDYAELDPVEYAAGEVVGVKLITNTSSDVLSLAAAPADSVTLNQRANRPYAPGKLLINGSAYPASIGASADLALTWAHRDRLQQTGGSVIDTTATSIGPESGTTYNLRIYGESGTLGKQVTGITGAGYTYTAASELAEMGVAGAAVWTAFNANIGSYIPYAVANNGAGLWVMVGESGKIATSTNGTTWTARTSGTANTLRGVAFGGGLWVAVGDSGTLITSPDGITWTARTSTFGTTWIRAIAYGAGRFVAVGDIRKIATSNDGVTWTAVDTSGFDFGDNLMCVAYGGGKWMAGMRNTRIATSTNGTTWTLIASGVVPTPAMHVLGIAYGNGVWVAVGSNDRIKVSADGGASWVSRSGGFGAPINFYEWTINGVAFGGDSFLCVASCTGATDTPAKFSMSTDNGTTWVLQPGLSVLNAAGYDTPLYAVAFSGSYMVAGFVATFPNKHGAYLAPGPARLNNSLRIELESQRGGLVSWQTHNHTITRST